MTTVSGGRALLSLLLLGLVLSPPLSAQLDDRPNVLLIVSDDLRELTFDPPVAQPHKDRLAARSMVFTRAYTQQPVCNPSRTSMLTGLRPQTTGISDNTAHFRTRLPDVVTLPQAFLAAGYFTASLGKIFHKQQRWRERNTWSHEAFPGGKPIGRRGRGRSVTGGRLPDDRWRAAKGDDADQPDGAAALEAVRLMAEERDRPFFLAVGFLRPHAPFRAPRKHFRPYKLESFPETFDELPPAEVPMPAIPNRSTAAAIEGMTGRDRQQLMRAYYACTSFVDRQLGILLDGLDELDLWKNTIVIFTSDHGYHVGDHGWWGKNTLFEESLRVPLLIHTPNMNVAGKVSERTVELLDIFPTLVELTGIEGPAGLEGRSLRPLMRRPSRSWHPAFSQADRGSTLGRSVRDGRWRYTEWESTGEAELYDTSVDPDEMNNLAGDPELADVEARLRLLLGND